MTEITPPVNQPIADVNSALKSLVSLGTGALEKALNTAAPWTALPILRELIDMGIGWVTGTIYTALALETDYLVIKFQTYVEKTNYLSAVSDLKMAQAGTDPLKLKAAELAFAAAASKLIHSDGSSPP